MYRYLLPFDGSGNALHAARYVLKMAEEHSKVEIIVLSVKETAAWFTENVDDLAEKAASVFKGSEARVKTLVKEGEPARIIAETADELGVDHIVMGARGLSNLQGMLLGSVSQKVIHLCKCPVTIIK